MSYFTTNDTFFIVPLNTSDGEIQKINVFLGILEESRVGEIIEKNFSKSNLGRKSYNPYKLFASILYCFAMHKGTLRDCEEMIKYDLRLNYINNQATPSYKTICEFINKIILPNTYEIFYLITNAIINKYTIDTSIQYLDGTKIEANANKYKFVWKPRKHHKNLDIKIKALLETIDQEYSDNLFVTSDKLLSILRDYVTKNNIKPSEIPNGKGKRLTKQQNLYKLGVKYLNKLLEYEEKERICGPNRNSYYKTDHDATAMALKTDYYSGHGSNMHAAYNVQFLVSSGLITFFGVFQDRNDFYTLTPLLIKYHDYYDAYPNNLSADSGYGIYDNYIFLKEHNINNYVKFLNWNGESSGKNPNKFFLNETQDGFMCLNNKLGKEIAYDNSNHQKNKNSKMYIFESCVNCGYSYVCKAKLKDKNKNYRKAELNIEYEKLKNEARDNLLSLQGIEIRINRSIQAEGSFGNLKQNVSYVRFRRRGMKRVSLEIMLMALALNIRKLFVIYNQSQIKSKYWNTKDNNATESETFKKPKEKAVTN